MKTSFRTSKPFIQYQVTGLLVMAAFLCVFLAGSPAWAKVTKIGILAPLTGGAAADGEEIVRGAQLAVEEINKAGGVNGYTLKLIKGDVRDQVPDAISSAFKKITADKEVNVMMGGYVSGTNFEMGLMDED
jgi:branched-chain amino acid transport system substrate-binding protein